MIVIISVYSPILCQCQLIRAIIGASPLSLTIWSDNNYLVPCLLNLVSDTPLQNPPPLQKKDIHPTFLCTPVNMTTEVKAHDRTNFHSRAKSHWLDPQFYLILLRKTDMISNMTISIMQQFKSHPWPEQNSGVTHARVLIYFKFTWSHCHSIRFAQI